MVFIEFHHAECPGIPYRVAEDCGTLTMLFGHVQKPGEILTVEDVVSQHQTYAVITDKVRADDESVSQPPGLLLNPVAEIQPQPAAVAQELFVSADVLRRRDYQNVPYSRQHQHRDRIIDQWFVVNRQKLLGYGPGHGVEPGALSAG